MSDFSAQLRAARRVAATMRDVATQFADATGASGLARAGELGRVIEAFATPLDIAEDAEPAQRSLALLRAFDRHGAGLRPFDAADVTRPGDVLVAADRAIWIVDAVDETGRATALVGGRSGSKASAVLHWRPSSEARAWLSPRQAARTAYRDPATALADLAGYWGESESATRYFKRPEALFWQLTETPGVKFARRGLEDEADAHTIRAWLATRGARPIAEAPAAMPGDLFWHDGDSDFSVVLRADDTAVDVLTIGRRGPGSIGEKKGEATILRGVRLPPNAMIWRPV